MIGAYTVTSGIVENNRPTPDGSFDSGIINPGDSFPFVFDKAGEYPYYYTIHPFMTGKVTSNWMKTIYLTAAQIRQLATIAKEALPNESCAFLLGDNGKVVKILPMRNIDESPVTFSIEPAELLHAYNLAESEGMQVIAIFHSHPAKPSPSSTDIKFMEINPVIWLIYSTTENQLKAFVYDDDDIVEEIAIAIVSPRG